VVTDQLAARIEAILKREPSMSPDKEALLAKLVKALPPKFHSHKCWVSNCAGVRDGFFHPRCSVCGWVICPLCGECLEPAKGKAALVRRVLRSKAHAFDDIKRECTPHEPVVSPDTPYESLIRFIESLDPTDVPRIDIVPNPAYVSNQYSRYDARELAKTGELLPSLRVFSAYVSLT